MPRRFTRRELYDLVWSEPMRDIAAKFGMSDVGIAKACRNASIPVPPRGYWNKKKAGHKVFQLPLSPREPGHSDTVVIGGDRYWSSGVDVNGPEPRLPVFDEPIDAVRARIERRTRPIIIRSDFSFAHPAIRKILDKDDELREKQKRFSWYAPLFDSPVQQRRLRILNAILLAVSANGGSGRIQGDKAAETFVKIGSTHLTLLLESASSRKGAKEAEKADKLDRLRLMLRLNGTPRVLAEDTSGKRIEQQLRAVFIELLVAAEQKYRDQALGEHNWQLELRRRAVEDAAKARAEAERREKERLAALEKARVERLLDEADALQKATLIRSYVDQVRALNERLSSKIPASELNQWTLWALAQADRIDPISSRRFLEDDPQNSIA